MLISWIINWWLHLWTNHCSNSICESIVFFYVLMQEEWFLCGQHTGAVWPHRQSSDCRFDSPGTEALSVITFPPLPVHARILSRCEFECKLLFVPLCSPPSITCRYVRRCLPRLPPSRRQGRAPWVREEEEREEDKKQKMGGWMFPCSL